MKYLCLLILPLLFLNERANAQWQQLNGPSGGNIAYITSGPGGYVYAAASGSGIFRSDDNGTTWNSINSGLSASYINTIVFNDAGMLFASSVSNGVFRSVDYGNTWTEINSGISNLNIASLAINESGYLFAGSISHIDESATVYRSTDNGETWTDLMLNPNNYVQQMVLGIGNEGEIYAGTDGLLLYSANNGDSWEELLINGIAPYVISMGRSESGDFYIGMNFGDGLWRKVNGSEQWEHVMDDDVYAIACDMNDNMFISTGSAILYSNTNGNSWMPTNDAEISGIINSLCAHNEGYVYAGAYGLYKTSDNGVTWIESTEGIYAARISDLITDESENIYALSRSVYKTTDYGNTWTKILSSNQELTFTSLSYDAEGRIYVTGISNTGGVLYVSENGGTTWNEILKNMTFFQVKAVVTDQQGRIYVATDGDGILVSDNGGTTWNYKNDGLGCLQLKDLAINESGVLITATGCYLTDLYRSADYSESWQPVDQNLNGMPTTLAVNNFGHFFSGSTLNNLYRSTDLGISWEELNPGDEVFHIFDIVTIDSVIYAATFTGLYESTDNGSTWSDVTNGIIINDIRSLTTSSQGLFAGTHGASVWRNSMLVNAPSQIIANSKIKIELYPNPAIDEILIKMPHSATYNYLITNLNGKAVINSTMTGDRSRINVSKLPSGIYTIRIKGGKESKSMKFVKL